MISALRWASDVSHFNVSLIVQQGKVTRQCPSTTIFEETGEPKRGVEPASYRLPAERLNHQAKPADRWAGQAGGSVVVQPTQILGVTGWLNW